MWCSTECWDCEDKKCEHYISKTELYFENQRLKDKLQQKENIIKEVREYNEKIIEEGWYGGFEKDNAKHNLEILDKENNNE